MKTEIKTTDGIAEAFSFEPSKNKRDVGVLVYMDALGIRPTLLEMCERLASEGYHVLLPNLFYRSSKLPTIPNFPDPAGPEDMKKAGTHFMPMMQALTPELLLRDASAYLDALPLKKVGIVGYCMGGAHAMRTAAHYPEKVQLVASYHGGKLPPQEVPKIRSRMYFGHADQDGSMPAEQIELLEKTLRENGKVFTSEVYAGAKHGFTMRDLPAFNQSALERHWKTLLSSLSRLP